MGHAQTGFKGWRSGDPMKAVAYERVPDWHTFAYGDDEQKYDGGKPVEPTLKVALPEQPTPARTPQGEGRPVRPQDRLRLEASCIRLRAPATHP
ncbi:MAG: hypothetical protein AB1918_10235 [Pseudomonadota bacterium]